MLVASAVPAHPRAGLHWYCTKGRWRHAQLHTLNQLAAATALVFRGCLQLQGLHAPVVPFPPQLLSWAWPPPVLGMQAWLPRLLVVLVEVVLLEVHCRPGLVWGAPQAAGQHACRQPLHCQCSWAQPHQQTVRHSAAARPSSMWDPIAGCTWQPHGAHSALKWTTHITLAATPCRAL